MSVWGAAKVWGGGARCADRAKLPKGSEHCHICADDEAFVEVKLRPCGHEICLECCNTMRAQIVFKADAGLKCPFCRNFVDALTDMQGRPDTVADLVEANRAARKSMVARRQGADKMVSTSVPDPQRLVPQVARAAPAEPSADATWACSQCRHANPSARAECARCRAPNPAASRSAGTKDVLACGEEEVARAACERHHPGLNRAFLEAGTPWANGSIGGTTETVRRALKSKGHERLMRVIHLLTAGGQLQRVAGDMCGNYAVQDLLEAAHKLRVEAFALGKAGTPPAEGFTALPPGSPCTALKAYSELLKQLAPAMNRLATSDKGVFVLVRLVKLGSPQEVVYIAEQANPFFVDWLSSKDGTLFVCQLVDRLAQVSLDGGASSPKAGDALNRMAAQLVQHGRALILAAKSPYAGPCLAEVVQGALPRPDAWKLGHQLALSALNLASTRTGSHTLELLTQLKPADLHCRLMARDLCCYMAKALQGHCGHLAAQAQQGGQALVLALLARLAAEREDEWVRQITREVVGAAADRDAEEVLVQCLSQAVHTPEEVKAYFQALEGLALDAAGLWGRVRAAQAAAAKLAPRVHEQASDVQPSSAAEVIHRCPAYVREGAAPPPRHSAPRKPVSDQERAAQQQQQPAAPLPPPGPPRQPQSPTKGPPPAFLASRAQGRLPPASSALQRLRHKRPQQP